MVSCAVSQRRRMPSSVLSLNYRGNTSRVETAALQTSRQALYGPCTVVGRSALSYQRYRLALSAACLPVLLLQIDDFNWELEVYNSVAEPFCELQTLRLHMTLQLQVHSRGIVGRSSLSGISMTNEESEQSS